MNGFMGNDLPFFSPPKASTKYLNSVQCMEIFNQLLNIALARFEWSGLPKTCDPMALEKTLLFYGKALFFYDDEIGGFFHTPCNLPGPFNIYYESIVREAYSFDYRETYTIENSVLIKASQTMVPDYLSIWNYVPRIADGIRAIDVHMQTLKRPYVIVCEEKQRNTVIRTINRITDNEIAVIGEKGMTGSDISVLNLNSSSNLSEMWSCVKQYYNAVFNSLGIKNAFTDKKERLVTTEANGQTNSTRHALESELYAREMAVEKINSMYNLNVSVRSREVEDFTDELIEFLSASRGGQQEGVIPNVPESPTISE